MKQNKGNYAGFPQTFNELWKKCGFKGPISGLQEIVFGRTAYINFFVKQTALKDQLTDDETQKTKRWDTACEAMRSEPQIAFKYFFDTP